MKDQYIDIVVAENPEYNGKFVCYAPMWSGFADGDHVIIDTVRGAYPAVVRRTCTISVRNDADFLSTILFLAGEEVPLKKVLSIVRLEDISYPDDSDEAFLPEEDDDDTV